MTKIIRTTDHADNTGSPLVVFIRWVSAYPFPPVACPPRRVIRGPLLRPIGRAINRNRLFTEMCDSRLFVYFAVQIFRQNDPHAQTQCGSHSVNSVRGSAPVSPHRLGRLSQSPLPEKLAGRFCLWRYREGPRSSDSHG